MPPFHALADSARFLKVARPQTPLLFANVVAASSAQMTQWTFVIATYAVIFRGAGALALASWAALLGTER